MLVIDDILNEQQLLECRNNFNELYNLKPGRDDYWDLNTPLHTDDFNRIDTYFDKTFTPKHVESYNHVWWGGWWNEPTNNIQHQVIEWVTKRILPMIDMEGAKGFEYWTFPNSQGDPSSNYWHTNRNEFLDNFKQTEGLGSVWPMYSIVTYGLGAQGWDVTGGELEVSSRRHREGSIFMEGEKLIPGYKELLGETELIKPKHNRTIVIDGELYHRVREHEGTRWAFVFDIWDEDLPQLRRKLGDKL